MSIHSNLLYDQMHENIQDYKRNFYLLNMIVQLLQHVFGRIELHREQSESKTIYQSTKLKKKTQQ